MGMGAFFQGLDDRIVNQARQREMAARDGHIAAIRGGFERNPNEEGVMQAINQYAAQDAAMGLPQDALMQQAAAGQQRQIMAEQGYGIRHPLQSINHAMAESRPVRYGVIGGAAVGGGMAMTAGAQKLLGLMDALSESDQTDMARDQPLTS